MFLFSCPGWLAISRSGDRFRGLDPKRPRRLTGGQELNTIMKVVSILKNKGADITHHIGLLDSAVDLGINAPLQDRILYRRTTSCAMLSTEDRVESEVADMQGTPWPNLNTTYFDYGRNVQENTSYTHSDDNYTTSTYTYNFAYDVK